MKFRSTASIASAIEAETDDLVAALRDFGDDDLAGRLWRCQQARKEKVTAQRTGVRTGWPTMCRSVACPSCRRWLGRGWRERASSHFAAASGPACSHVTIMLACTGDLDAIRGVVRDLRVDLRNLRDRSASRSRRWATVAAYGLVEVDAHLRDDVMFLPPRRRAVVQELPYLGRGPVAWVPHAHLCFHHPRLDRAALREALSTQWPGAPGRVDVRPFDNGDADFNAGNIAAYAAKMRMTTTMLNGVEEEWPVTWRAAYWSWLCGQRAGLAPLRLRLGPMGTRTKPLTLRVEPPIEPMPILIT